MNSDIVSDVTDVGFVVKDRLDNVIAAHYVENNSELAELVNQVNSYGYLLYQGKIIIDDSGNKIVSNNLSKYVGKTSIKIEEPAKMTSPVIEAGKTPDEIISEAFDLLMAAGDSGVEQQVILNLMGSVISTTPAFSLRMKSFLSNANTIARLAKSGIGDKMVMERFGKPVRYKIVSDKPNG